MRIIDSHFKLGTGIMSDPDKHDQLAVLVNWDLVRSTMSASQRVMDETPQGSRDLRDAYRRALCARFEPCEISLYGKAKAILLSQGADEETAEKGARADAKTMAERLKKKHPRSAPYNQPPPRNFRFTGRKSLRRLRQIFPLPEGRVGVAIHAARTREEAYASIPDLEDVLEAIKNGQVLGG